MPAAAERFAVTRSAIVAPQAGKIECVSKVSLLRKAGVVARVAGEQAGRSRTVNALWRAARTTARSFGHVLHQLWLEVAGVIFLIMALSLGGKTAQEYGKYHAGQVGPGRVALAVGFTLAFAWFGLSSFWRAHKKKQRS
jgi:hypothetical protein